MDEIPVDQLPPLPSNEPNRLSISLITISPAKSMS